MASIENSLKYESEVEPGKVLLVTSGEFVRAYNHSAWLFYCCISKYKVIRKYSKAQQKDVFFLGFPVSKLLELTNGRICEKTDFGYDITLKPEEVPAEEGYEAWTREVPVEAASRADATERVPPGVDAMGGSRSVATAERVLPVRKHPSRNSILTTRDNRAIILFVTVVANNRQSVLADGKVQSLLLDMWWRVRGWIVGRYMIMPDHIHFFCAPTDYPPPDSHAWMACWKRMVSNRFPCPHALPLWQRDCWDTQLRCGESYAAKWEYVRANPVRKGLVDNPDSWPFQGELNVLAWHDR